MGMKNRIFNTCRNGLLVALFTFFIAGCGKSKGSDTSNPPPPPVTNEVDFWLTKSDGSVKLQKQNVILAFGNVSNQYANIEVDENTSFQTIDGFGYTLTGGSAEVINSLDAAKRQELLQELFGQSATAIAVNYLRI